VVKYPNSLSSSQAKTQASTLSAGNSMYAPPPPSFPPQLLQSVDHFSPRSKYSPSPPHATNHHPHPLPKSQPTRKTLTPPPLRRQAHLPLPLRRQRPKSKPKSNPSSGRLPHPSHSCPSLKEIVPLTYWCTPMPTVTSRWSGEIVMRRRSKTGRRFS